MQNLQSKIHTKEYCSEIIHFHYKKYCIVHVQTIVSYVILYSGDQSRTLKQSVFSGNTMSLIYLRKNGTNL